MWLRGKESLQSIDVSVHCRTYLSSRHRPALPDYILVIFSSVHRVARLHYACSHSQVYSLYFKAILLQRVSCMYGRHGQPISTCLVHNFAPQGPKIKFHLCRLSRMRLLTAIDVHDECYFQANGYLAVFTYILFLFVSVVEIRPVRSGWTMRRYGPRQSAAVLGASNAVRAGSMNLTPCAFGYVRFST